MWYFKMCVKKYVGKKGYENYVYEQWLWKIVIYWGLLGFHGLCGGIALRLFLYMEALEIDDKHDDFFF